MNDEPEPELDLEPIKAREAAATPGPWESKRGDDHCEQKIVGPGERMLFVQSWKDGHAELTREVRNDCLFIAHARADVPALVREVERLREQIEDMQNRGAGWEE